MGIPGIIWETLKIWGAWFVGYNKPENVKSRQLNEQAKEKDELNEAINKNDTDEIRKKLRL